MIHRFPLQYERAKSLTKRLLPLNDSQVKRVSAFASTLHQKYIEDFVFIHINKCGGTAIERALGIPFLNHDTALMRRAKLGDKRWKERYKFSFVRNPYERIVSNFFYSYPDKSVSYREIVSAFPSWIERRAEDVKIGSGPQHKMPMLFWVSDSDGNIILDEIFKLEEHDAAIKKISEKLGRNLILKRVKTNPVKYDKNDILSDKKLKEMIYEIYKQDFEAFGYEP